MKRVDNRGSFTIEASVVMSLLIMVITAVLFLTFFLYNRCLLERAASMSALRASGSVREDQDARYKRAEEGIKDILQEHLFGDPQIQTSIEIKGNDAEVTLIMQYKWWKFEASATKKAVYPVTFIRNCRKLEGVMSEL